MSETIQEIKELNDNIAKLSCVLEAMNNKQKEILKISQDTAKALQVPEYPTNDEEYQAEDTALESEMEK